MWYCEGFNASETQVRVLQPNQCWQMRLTASAWRGIILSSDFGEWTSYSVLKSRRKDKGLFLTCGQWTLFFRESAVTPGMHACMHACMHAYIHTYIHSHTYIHTHTRTHSNNHTYHSEAIHSTKTSEGWTFVKRRELRCYGLLRSDWW